MTHDSLRLPGTNFVLKGGNPNISYTYLMDFNILYE